MAARGQQPVSVALEPLPLPEQVVQNGTRLDGRGFEEFRPVFVNTKVVSRAVGSAYAEFSNTKVMVAVYGPRQAERRHGFSALGRIHCEVSYTSFASQERSRQAQRANAKVVSSMLQQALEASVDLSKFPKAVLDVYCCVLEAGGAEEAAVITAASMAVADAGIELYDLVPACCVSLINGQLLLDPTSVEMARQEGSLLLAMMPSSNEVTQMVMSGSWSSSQTKEALALATAGCSQLKQVMRQTLLDAILAGSTSANGEQPMQQ
eukprot:jgi/Chrzof1/9041/Cz03g33280.t1